MRKYLVWLLILAIFCSELILEVNSIAGSVFYASILFAFLISLNKLKKQDNFSKILIVLMILPTIRITFLFLNLPSFWRILAGYYALLFIVLFYLVKFKEDVGFIKPKFKSIFLAILIAVFLGLAGNTLLFIKKSTLFILILPLASLAEEIFFRGLVQNLAEKANGRIQSIILTSVLYATVTSSLGIIPPVFFFFSSLVSSLLYGSTRNIFLTMIINFIVGLFIFVIPKVL